MRAGGRVVNKAAVGQEAVIDRLRTQYYRRGTCRYFSWSLYAAAIRLSRTPRYRYETTRSGSMGADEPLVRLIDDPRTGP